MGLEMAVRDMERSDEEESDDEIQTLKGVCCWDLKRFYIYLFKMILSYIFVYIFSSYFCLFTQHFSECMMLI